MFGVVFVLGGKVPADRYTHLLKPEYIAREAFYIVMSVGTFGIFLAAFFLGFNLYHHNLRWGKLVDRRKKVEGRKVELCKPPYQRAKRTKGVKHSCSYLVNKIKDIIMQKLLSSKTLLYPP